MGIINYFVDKTFFASIISAFVMLVGGMTLSNMHLQEFPDMEIPMTLVTTTVQGAAASDIEYGVTNKIEDELKSVAGIDEYISTSKEGRSQIKIFIDEEEDLDKVNDDIQAAVDRAQDILDDEIPIVEPFSLGRFAVMSFGVYSDNATEFELQEYTRQLEKKLRKLPSVSGLDINGAREREFLIELEPDKIKAYKLDFNTISNKLVIRNVEASGGLLDTQDGEKRILTYSRFQNQEDIENTILDILDNGTIVKLKDVATVKDTYETKTSSAFINNKEGISFDIKKATSADIRKVIQDVNELLEKETEIFDGKFKYETGMDLSKDMAERFGVVITNGMMGLFFVILILSLSLKKQVSFWVSVSVPFCVLGVVTLLPFFGISLDSITLAALLLVIGIIVDDSVVVAESISQYRQKGYSQKEASILGVKAVFKPIIASLSTTCLVFIPMLKLTGPLGNMIYVVPVVVVLALLMSLIDCLFLLPAHINKGKIVNNEKEKDNFIKIKAIYISLLKKFINNKFKVIISSILVTIAVIMSGSLLKMDFFPSENAKYIKMRINAPNGASMEEIEKVNLEVIGEVKKIVGEDLKSIIFTNGQPKSSAVIELVHASEREKLAKDYTAQFRKLDFGEYNVRSRVDAPGPPSGDPVDLRVISSHDDKREEAIVKAIEYMESLGYLKDIERSDEIKDQQIRVFPNYEWIERYDYSVKELSNLLKFVFDGQTSTSMWIGDDEIDLRLSLSEKYQQLNYLKHTKIEMPNGQWIPIGQLVTIQEIVVPNELTHFNGEEYTSITADIDERGFERGEVPSSISVMEEFKKVFKEDLYVKYGFEGEGKDTEDAMKELIQVFVISIFGMYFVLALLLNSLIQPFLILIILPYAFGGSIGALVIHNSDLSFFGLIGLLGMFGVVVNNSLVLVNRANELKAEGLNKMDAILQAAESRLRPIILTSLTTIFCLLPLVYGVGGSDEYMSPMAMTLGYGLLLTIPIVLFVVPCYYLIMTRDKK